MEMVSIIISLIGAIAAIIAVVFSYKASRQTAYVNAITSERIRLLSELKSMASEYLVRTTKFASLPDMVETQDVELLMTLNRNIIFQINSKHGHKGALCARLSELFSTTMGWEEYLDGKYGEDKRDAMNRFISALSKVDNEFHILFKIEWEKIKKEANGKKLSVEEIDSMRREFGSNDEFLNSKLNILQ